MHSKVDSVLESVGSLLRGASGLMCTGTAESKQAWCSMLRDLFSASGAAVSDAVLLSVYLVCEEFSRRGHARFSDEPAIARACHDASQVSEAACKAHSSPKFPPPSLSSFQHTQEILLAE